MGQTTISSDAKKFQLRQKNWVNPPPPMQWLSLYKIKDAGNDKGLTSKPRNQT